VNPVIASITWRVALCRRRAILLFVFPALLLALTIILSAAVGEPRDWVGGVVGGLGVGAVVPLIALIVGTSVLGMEIEDGNIIHLLTKPVPRHEIILTKLVVASAVTILFAAVPITLATFLALPDEPGTAFGLGLAAAVGSIVYSALFLMLSAMTRRAVPIGLLYILVWESLLGNIASGVRNLSINRYTLRIADYVADFPLRDTRITMRVAVVMSILVTVVATYVAIRKLRSFTIAGDITA